MKEQMPSMKIRFEDADGLGERVWARPVDGHPDRAVVANVPQAEALFLDDVVRIDAKGNIVELVERKWAEKSAICYEPVTKGAFVKVATYLREHDLLAFEGWVPGLLGLCHQPGLQLPEQIDGVTLQVFGPTTARFDRTDKPQIEGEA